MVKSDYVLWDFAGVDGLQAAIALFTPAISHLAPFQSLTADFNHRPCSVLRLCENNFRVALSNDLAFDEAIAELKLKVWSKPCTAFNLVIPTEWGLTRLAKVATTKPIYTLTPFPCDRAVPARVNEIAILAWHHLWNAQPRLTIQTASTNANKIHEALALPNSVI